MGPDGEIGKHSGLKIRRRKPYGFDSRSGHHLKNKELGEDHHHLASPLKTERDTGGTPPQNKCPAAAT